MNPALAQRTLVLAAVALLAVVGALAVAAVAGGSSEDKPAQPSSVPVAGTSWYRALAAAYRVDRGKRKLTACGQQAKAGIVGVAHPVLPCGAKLVIAYGDERVLTQVIDRATGVPGREFELTAALAGMLGLEGVQLIRWRFAAPPER